MDNASDIVVRFAVARDVEAVSSVLREAAAWLRLRGEPLWEDADLTSDAIAEEVAGGKYLLALLGIDAIGTGRLTLSDPKYWPEAGPGEAVYLHRLAVRRAHAGGAVASAILQWSRAYALALHCEYLRLDCDAGRPRLRRVYEEFGFQFHSERSVGHYTVARYQLRVLDQAAS